MTDLIERLRSPLPVCPYDRRSPDYWTAPDDKPCVVCGGLNDTNAPNLCRGADTRVMDEAADALAKAQRLADALAVLMVAMKNEGIAVAYRNATEEARAAIADWNAKP